VSVRLGAREATEDWLELGRDLIARGLASPRLVVADGAPARVYPAEAHGMSDTTLPHWRDSPDPGLGRTTDVAALRRRKHPRWLTMPLEAFPTIATEELRKRSVSNLLRIGHCAPTVIQTMLDASDTEANWLVLLTAGLPDGIGNTGGECAGLTAPLVLMGLRHRRDETADGLPVVVDAGHDLLQRFRDRHGTTDCRKILGNARVPLRCVGVVREAPAMCAECLAASGGRHVIAPDRRAAYRELYAHCDFATAEGVHAYIEHDGTIECARIARLVAERVADMIAAAP
jgi:hypothetical protein